MYYVLCDYVTYLVRKKWLATLAQHVAQMLRTVDLGAKGHVGHVPQQEGEYRIGCAS